MTGLAVLDLFAGTGAFGFEALSRGARRVVFVESNPRAVQAIRTNAVDLGVEREARVVVGRVDDVLRARRIDGPFDVILADPPYADTQEEGLVAAVAASGLLDPGGVLAVEREARGTVPAASGTLAPYRTARYGRTAIDFFKFS